MLSLLEVDRDFGLRVDDAVHDVRTYLATVLGRGSKRVYFALRRERTHSRSESLLVEALLPLIYHKCQRPSLR